MLRVCSLWISVVHVVATSIHLEMHYVKVHTYCKTVMYELRPASPMFATVLKWALLHMYGIACKLNN